MIIQKHTPAFTRSFSTFGLVRYFHISREIVDSYKKKRFLAFYLSSIEFLDRNLFMAKLKALDPSFRYTILFRVCFGSQPSYKMLGEQVGLDYEHSSLQDIHDKLLLTLESTMENYNFNGDDIITIQLLVYQVEYSDTVIKPPKLDLSLVSLGDNRDLVSERRGAVNLALNKVIPPSMDLSIYGEKLKTNTENGRLKSVLYKEALVELPSLIAKNNIKKKDIVLDETTQIYSPLDKYLVSVKCPQPIEGSPSVKEHNIDVFTVEGRHILALSDREINSSIFTRTTGNVTKTIDTNNASVTTSLKVIFDKISVPQKIYMHKQLSISNPRFGTLDLETYVDEANISKVYALGFYTKQKGAEIFYINENLDSAEVVLRCIDSMLVAKYSGFIFYVHNFGDYDFYFLINILIKSNLKKMRYILDPFAKDNKILSLTIKAGGYQIKLVDSYNILNHSLKKLALTYNLDIKKDIFPYGFVKVNTIFYKGHKPDKALYDKAMDDSLYNSIPSLWDTKVETLKYLEIDLKSLYEAMDKFSAYIYRNHSVQVTGSLTISSLAMKIFLTRFYKGNIPLINKRSIYEDIKKSYFGGITEVYRPYGEGLYYYDVNSLYPYAAHNPMPGCDCVYEDTINLDLSKASHLFGFYYCTIKTGNAYLGLLPVRTKPPRGWGIIMANGEWSGWYFSEEARFAMENGYEIYVHKGYTFNKVYGVFDSYVGYLYNIKSTTKSVVEKAISKSLLNNLLGRFGLDINKSKTELMDMDTFNDIAQTKSINSVSHIEDMLLVNYNNKVSSSVCKDHNADYKSSVLNSLKKGNDSEKTFSDVSIAIASAVTSYARITITKAKLDILSKGGRLYYSDTDSIVTDRYLSSEKVGEALGNFKLEHEVDRAYFISSKTYLLVNKDGGVVIKAKGVNNHNLTEKDYISLAEGNTVETVRTWSEKNISDGYVNINVDKICLDGNAFFFFLKKKNKNICRWCLSRYKTSRPNR